jgi:pyruvate dehydrogenase E2 component (dihydrolipoamide acetyltransferase)
MPTVIQMPKLGHAMTEGTVVRWHKKPGQTVSQGDIVLTVETDKAEVDVEAPDSGIIADNVPAEGAVIPVGGVLATILQPGEAAPVDGNRSTPNASADADKPETPSAVDEKRAAEKRPSRILASPRAKRLAADHGIDLGNLVGRGEAGTITEDDVRQAIEQSSREAMERSSRSTGHQHPGVAANKPGSSARGEKLTRIQAAGARNVAASWKEIPHFVQMLGIDMSRTLAARRHLNTAGAKYSVTDLILFATAQALKANPRVNASFGGDEILIHEHVNLGVAVDTSEGLIVPVIHDAGSLDLATLSARLADIAGRARLKKLAMADLEGGTFTVSNLGAYGIETGTPVIIAPQAAIMFTGVIKDEVIAVSGQPVVRPVMQIAIAYDHRVLDGATASRFTTAVRDLLEKGNFGPSPGPNLDEPHSDEPSELRSVHVESHDSEWRTSVRSGATSWSLSAQDQSPEDQSAPDPVTAFLGALGSCLLMSLRVAARARHIELGAATALIRSNPKGHVKEINVELKVACNENDDKLTRLVEVAERGCHIKALIRDEIKVNLNVARI